MTRLAVTVAAVAVLIAPACGAEGERERADVLSVVVRGSPGAYTFMVTVRSPDEGCDRYANWWEAVSPEGVLLYRRILMHSHVEEQPFARPGGPVPVEPETEVMVRAHFHPDGYGGQAMVGSAAGGFEALSEPPADFAEDLGLAPPQPTGCRY